MRVAQVLVLVLAVATVVGAYTAVAEELKSVVVVYGRLECPACKSLLSILEDAGIKHVFVDLSRCGRAEYERIVEMFSLEPVIPISVVFTKKGWPGYVIVGAISNLDMWRGMIHDIPMDHIVVFDIKELRKGDATLAPELVEVVKSSLSSCTTATSGVERVTGPSLTGIEVIAIAGAAVATTASVAIIAFKKRR